MAPFDSLDEEQESHTIHMTGFGTPILPEQDTQTVHVVYVPKSTYSYDPYYSNCTMSSNWWAPAPKSDEEQKRAWREYWQGFYTWRGTPYRRIQSQLSQSVKRTVANIPGLRALKKQAFSPAMRSHRRFMANLTRSAGFLHSRTF